jgi:uncharacterized protein YodC (DUF2158 family)
VATFKPGDHVRAKHVDGPNMVVNTVITATNIRCIWFVAKKMHSEQFHPDALELVPEGETKK